MILIKIFPPFVYEKSALSSFGTSFKMVSLHEGHFTPVYLISKMNYNYR